MNVYNNNNTQLMFDNILKLKEAFHDLKAAETSCAVMQVFIIIIRSVSACALDNRCSNWNFHWNSNCSYYFYYDINMTWDSVSLNKKLLQTSSRATFYFYHFLSQKCCSSASSELRSLTGGSTSLPTSLGQQKTANYRVTEFTSTLKHLSDSASRLVIDTCSLKKTDLKGTFVDIPDAPSPTIISSTWNNNSCVSGTSCSAARCSLKASWHWSRIQWKPFAADSNKISRRFRISFCILICHSFIVLLHSCKWWLDSCLFLPSLGCFDILLEQVWSFFLMCHIFLCLVNVVWLQYQGRFSVHLYFISYAESAKKD